LHWRWIVRIARQFVFAPQPQPVPVRRAAPLLKPVPAAATVTRRDFLKLMGIVGAASALAFTSAFNGDDDGAATSSAATVQEAVNPTASPATNATAPSQVVSNATPTSSPTQGVVTTPAESSNSPVTGSTAPQPAANQSAASTTACTTRCPKNRHCSLPGDCRRYQDSTGNGRCDLGECA